MAKKIPMQVMCIGGREKCLVPIFDEDIAYINKLPIDQTILVSCTYNRRVSTNAKFWAIASFFMANLPESLEAELGGHTVDYFVEYWLKHEIKFIETSIVHGIIKESPRRTNFEDLPDEAEYMTKFHNPGLETMRYHIGYATVEELEEASLEWKNNRPA